MNVHRSICLADCGRTDTASPAGRKTYADHCKDSPVPWLAGGAVAMGAIGLLGQQAMAGATIAGQEPKFILGLYLNAVVVRAPPPHVLRPGRAVLTLRRALAQVAMFGGPLGAIKEVNETGNTTLIPFPFAVASAHHPLRACACACPCSCPYPCLCSCPCPPAPCWSGFAQDAHGPSPAAAFANCSTWTAFGLLVLHDPIVWFPNVLGFGSACAQLFMHAKFGINVPGSSAEPEPEPVPEPEPEAEAAEEKKKE